MTFHVGQKVVCVESFCGQGEGVRRWPDHVTKDGVYTVRQFFVLYDQLACLYLDEFVAPIAFGREVPFEAKYFRPVIERKTDISIFTALLTPSPERTKELCGND